MPGMAMAMAFLATARAPTILIKAVDLVSVVLSLRLVEAMASAGYTRRTTQRMTQC